MLVEAWEEDFCRYYYCSEQAVQLEDQQLYSRSPEVERLLQLHWQSQMMLL